MEEKYKVYMADSECSYVGIALVAAENAEKANQYIRQYKEHDQKNEANSFGISYVTEEDVVEDVYAEIPGFVLNKITYSGW